MSVSYTAFVSRYQEFKNVDRLLVEECLKEALERTPYDTWGTKQRMGIMTLAAYLIVSSPIGESTKQKEESEITAYEKERRRLEGEVAFGLGRVV